MERVSTEDISRYDRQIRVWGLEGQQRLSSASVLAIGVSGFVLETLKNLVLGGIGEIKVIDEDIVSEADLESLYILNDSHLNMRKDESLLKELKQFNPSVKLTHEARHEFDATYFKNFDLVLFCNADINKMEIINAECRKAGVKYMCAGLYGMYGYVFADLLDHEYKLDITRKNPNNPDEEIRVIEECCENYVPLDVSLKKKIKSVSLKRMKSVILPAYFIILGLLKSGVESAKELSEDDVEMLLSNVDSLLEHHEIAASFIPENMLRSCIPNIQIRFPPAEFVLGGILAQEIIKIISGKSRPISNWIVLDALEPEMLVVSLK